MDFEQQRKAEDAALLQAFGIRRSADIQRAAQKYGYAGDDPAALAFRDKLFCAAARHYGARDCQACGRLTLEMNTNDHRSLYARTMTNPSGNIMICDECQFQVDLAIRDLPQWVKDRDLVEVLPALVRAYIQTAREARESVSA